MEWEDARIVLAEAPVRRAPMLKALERGRYRCIASQQLVQRLVSDEDGELERLASNDRMSAGIATHVDLRER
jgi:hypothetical protein